MAGVTLKEIAEKTGFTIRSVKRAIEGQKGVSEESRQEILKIVQKLGYVPNIAARNLRLGQNNFVGLFYSADHMSHVLHRKIVGLQQMLEAHGLFAIFGILKEDPERLRNDLQKLAGLASSVVFLSWNAEWNPKFLLRGLPQQFIFVDSLPGVEGFHSIRIDRSAGICAGICYLLDQGRSRILRCGDIPYRAEGFRRAFEDAPSHVRHFQFPVKPETFDAVFSQGSELMKFRPDAVFFDTDKMACGFLKYCWQHRIKVPEDVAVIGFDDEVWDVFTAPALSTVSPPLQEANRLIVELVLAPPDKPVSKILQTQFIRRESV